MVKKIFNVDSSSSFLRLELPSALAAQRNAGGSIILWCGKAIQAAVWNPNKRLNKRRPVLFISFDFTVEGLQRMNRDLRWTRVLDSWCTLGASRYTSGRFHRGSDRWPGLFSFSWESCFSRTLVCSPNTPCRNGTAEANASYMTDFDLLFQAWLQYCFWITDVRICTTTHGWLHLTLILVPKQPLSKWTRIRIKVCIVCMKSLANRGTAVYIYLCIATQ